MSALRHLSPLRSRLLLALFACAMLVRAMIPAGWMPVADAQGYRIVPCSGTGPMATALARPAHHAMAGMHHGKDTEHSNPGADHPCAFAGVTPAITGPAFSVPPAPVLVRTTPAPIRTLATIGHGLAAPPPPQTGPPTFA